MHRNDLRWVVSGRQRFVVLPGVALEQAESDLEGDLVAGRIDPLLTPAVADLVIPRNKSPRSPHQLDKFH